MVIPRSVIFGCQQFKLSHNFKFLVAEMLLREAKAGTDFQKSKNEMGESF